MSTRKTPLQIVFEEAAPHVKKYITTLNPRDFEGMDVNAICEYLRATMPKTQRVARPEVENDVTIQALNQIQTSLRPGYTYNSITFPRRYLVLDTRNRNTAYDNYVWSIVGFSSSQAGEINARENLQQIIEITCQPFRIPLQTLYYDSVRMGIREFDDQGIELATCERFTTHNYFHFEFDTEVRSNWLHLTPKATWRPSRVITQCNSLSLTFYGNSERMIFAPDRLTATTAVGFPAVFTTTVAHGMSTGDLIYVTQGNLYNVPGYIVAVLSPTTFSIQATETGIETVTFIIAARRIQIPLIFTCLE